MADTPGFLFGGRLSLDLTWTLRYRAVWPTELLEDPAALGCWLGLAGLPVPERPSQRHLTAAKDLREAIHAGASAVADGGRVADDDRELVNRWAARPPPVPVLAPDGSRRTVARPGSEVAAGLSAIARDAIGLLAAGDGRLRRCEGPHCSLLFHDDSRPGTRRWCTTARCGNRVNTKAYRQRRRRA